MALYHIKMTCNHDDETTHHFAANKTETTKVVRKFLKAKSLSHLDEPKEVEGVELFKRVFRRKAMAKDFDLSPEEMDAQGVIVRRVQVTPLELPRRKEDVLAMLNALDL